MGADMAGQSTDALIDVGVSRATCKVLGERFSATAPIGSKPAIIPILGVLCSSDEGIDFFYGGTSYQSIQEDIDRAVNDPAIGEIILLVDSPGGDVVNLPETADMLYAARQVKPVTAVVIGCAASAAYWLVSQSNSIVLTPSGEVGSVGVRTAHVDLTKMYADLGIKVTDVSAGKYKSELASYVVLSDDAKAALQAQVDEYYGMFLASIARGRGANVRPEMASGNYGEGRMLSASDALTGGLVDKIASIRDLFQTRAMKAKMISEARQRSIDLL